MAISQIYIVHAELRYKTHNIYHVVDSYRWDSVVLYNSGLFLNYWPKIYMVDVYCYKPIYEVEHSVGVSYKYNYFSRRNCFKDFRVHKNLYGFWRIDV
jgi:hypothetical protein